MGSRNSERSASESSYVFRLLILAAERRSIWDGVPRSLSWTGKGSFKFCWVSFQNQVNQKYNLSTQMYSFDSFSRVQQVFLAYFSVDTVEGLKNHHKQFSVLDQCFSCCPSATLCPYMRFLIGCLQSYWSLFISIRKTTRHPSLGSLHCLICCLESPSHFLVFGSGFQPPPQQHLEGKPLFFRDFP